MKRQILRLLVTVALALPASLGAASPAAAPADGDLRSVLESLRSDVNGFKVGLLNQVMALSDAEAERFWPVYRAYERELAALSDRKVALIRDFAALRNRGPIAGADWEALTRRWLANAQDRIDLWRKYQRRVARAVSPMCGAQFLQVEHQIALFIDLGIASEMPVLGESPKP
jgi:hypothetical protein